MRLLLALLPALLSAQGLPFPGPGVKGYGGISTTPVNQTTCGPVSSGTTITCTVPTPTSPNLLVLACATNDAANSISGTGITGTVTTDGNGWRVADTSNTNRTIIQYYAIAGGAGTTIISNWTNAFPGTNAGCNVTEWSGANTSNALDVHGNSHSTGANTTATTATVTPAASGDLCIANARVGNSVSAPGSGFSALNTPNANEAYADLVPATASGTSTFWTFTSATWDTVIACYKP